MAGVPWTCPHCSRPTTVTDSDMVAREHDVTLKSATGPHRIKTNVIVCPNPECSKTTLQLVRYAIEQRIVDGPWRPKERLNFWQLIPESSARSLPGYVPSPIVADYTEACLIVDKSPKASATLARRCLQGMIRDFFEIRRDRLIDEIKAIKDRVDPLTWNAIDAVRSIGNIGAHMEKDINLIVDVDEGEAKELIQLIELLIEDWYVSKHNRQIQLEAILKIKTAKDAAKHQPVLLTVPIPKN